MLHSPTLTARLNKASVHVEISATTRLKLSLHQSLKLKCFLQTLIQLWITYTHIAVQHVNEVRIGWVELVTLISSHKQRKCRINARDSCHLIRQQIICDIIGDLSSKRKSYDVNFPRAQLSNPVDELCHAFADMLNVVHDGWIADHVCFRYVIPVHKEHIVIGSE